MGLFDGKNWNSEVFQKYSERIPNLKRDQLIKSGAIRMRPDLAAKLSDDVGGNYITTPLKGLIGGSGEDDGTDQPGGMIETNIYIDGKKTARAITPYVAKELDWEDK